MCNNLLVFFAVFDKIPALYVRARVGPSQGSGANLKSWLYGVNGQR
jgi:hypothetical protein